MKSLDPKNLAISKYWLKHVLFPYAGLGSVPPAQILLSDGFFAYDIDKVKICCKELYKEATGRAWEDLDGVLIELAMYYFEFEGQKIQMKEKFVAEAIAWMCKINQIDWDDKSHSKYELDFFKKTILGKALWSFECFASQYDKAVSSQSASTPKQSTQKTTKSTSVGNPNSTSTPWKQRGPMSSQIRDLIGQPGVKNVLNTSKIYFIEDINNKKKGKKFIAFTMPTERKGEINGTNKVFLGYCNNYNQPICFFESYDDAANFLNRLNSEFSYPGTLSISSDKTDSNGYFEINTELGKCLIRAFNMNEEITNEEFSEAFEKYCSYLD